ncbi:hypothetical protein EHS19_08745 [Bifidobacterium jacchi]|uniref:Uncharacterized protein n=1 Tax=Bifidobacterium jacchi TaxID=2490545 RepID=A0A5N5RET3_9BIFI|nr:hypothetical protein EHS19_08745 [Bifidobacterium jacchi]
MAERELLETLSPSKALSAREIGEVTGRGLMSVRKFLRSLIVVGLVTATAPASSRNCKYKLESNVGR